MKKNIMMASLLGVLSIGSTVASANIGAYNAFNAHYINPATCTSCHTGTPGVTTTLGVDWKAQGGSSQAGPSTQAGWDALDIKYATNYGGVNPNWTFSAPTPVGTASLTGCVASSLSTPLMMFLAMLSLGFVVRRKR
ncbi:hypothetical protein [Ghiorsea bivora]|uniref:hypothetical protein n=1 Tax=Ghiorsea bivora TaxID=1485545 RepID=UPI00056F5D8D|nr:hypothetical protein [Ghiorsea bivora]